MNTPLPFEQWNLDVQSELFRRATANLNRLEMAAYSPGQLFQSDTYDWPADKEGRTLLAWCLLGQSLTREPIYVQPFLTELPGRLNAAGYLGKLRPEGIIDEQQLSGHSWLLRGLCELQAWRPNAATYTLIEQTVHRLFLPCQGCFARYPLSPEQRIRPGEAIGHLRETPLDSWLLSTDIGCAFIPLDGLTHAYQIVQPPALRALIQEMIGVFCTIDFVGSSVQTHATLSGLRGLLRYYFIAPDDMLLAQVQRVFDLYLSEALTENYENHNWFGRPLWTEPCAVVDSFIVAVQLWQITERPKYLEIAQYILYNGLGYGQRPNGGFGCNVCTGGAETVLHPIADLFEAHWCCTMRGGEGLARAAQFTFFTDASVVSIPFPNSSRAVFSWDEGELRLSQTSAYPVQGVIDVQVEDSTLRQPKTIRWFLPGWIDTARVELTVNGVPHPAEIENGFVALSRRFRGGDHIHLQFPIPLRRVRERAAPRAHISLWHGALLLGAEGDVSTERLTEDTSLSVHGDGCYVTPDGLVLSPVNRLFELSFEAAKLDRRTILF